MAKNYVLDSFSLLAFFQKETGGETVKNLLLKAKKKEIFLYFSEINLGEVYYIAIRDWGLEKAQKLLAGIYELPINFVLPKRENILRAGEFKSEGNISYADCFVLDLAEKHDGVVVTGDPEFKKFLKKDKILWIGS